MYGQLYRAKGFHMRVKKWVFYLLSCHSCAQATFTESCMLLTHLRASIALNSIPKPSMCWMRRTLSPNNISGRDGICISSANLRHKYCLVRFRWCELISYARQAHRREYNRLTEKKCFLPLNIFRLHNMSLCSSDCPGPKAEVLFTALKSMWYHWRHRANSLKYDNNTSTQFSPSTANN